MLADQLPLAHQPYLSVDEPVASIHDRLVGDLHVLYGRITDLRDITAKDVWFLARDLVMALDRWSGPLKQLPGAQKMDIAVDVAWEFVQGRGGLRAVRDVLAHHVPVLPAFATRWLIKRVVNEGVARKLIRFVLELAVREMRDLSGKLLDRGTDA